MSNDRKAIFKSYKIDDKASRIFEIYEWEFEGAEYRIGIVESDKVKNIDKMAATYLTRDDLEDLFYALKEELNK